MRIVDHDLVAVNSLVSAPAGYPRIVESPTLKAVEKDRNTVMLCSASGNPEPTITWLKDYVPVDTTDPRLKVLPTGESILVYVYGACAEGAR